jgi:hypothetical protein
LTVFLAIKPPNSRSLSSHRDARLKLATACLALVAAIFWVRLDRTGDPTGLGRMKVSLDDLDFDRERGRDIESVVADQESDWPSRERGKSGVGQVRAVGGRRCSSSSHKVTDEL